MSNVNSPTTDLDWVGSVYELLLEIARCGLSDNPRLPDRISEKSLPLIQKAQEIEERNRGKEQSGWQQREKDWIQEVSQLFIDLTRISLSETPKIPENLPRNALRLADTAQSIQENLDQFGEESSPSSGDGNLDSPLSPDELLKALQISFQQQREKSGHPDASEWQQLFVLLDTIRGIYQRIS